MEYSFYFLLFIYIKLILLSYLTQIIIVQKMNTNMTFSVEELDDDTQNADISKVIR